MSTEPNTPQTTPPGNDADDAEKNKVFGILAYLGILFLVPLLAAPNSKFARYHANQGIVLFILAIAIWVPIAIIAFIPVVRYILILTPLIWLGILALAIIGIINAANGKCKPLPVIGGFTILK